MLYPSVLAVIPSSGRRVLAAGFGLLLSTGGLAINTQPERAHAAGIVVTSLADTLTADGQCTLREALANAQADSAVHADCAGGAGFDVVTFSLSGVITLASPLPQLAGTGGAITIDGAGQAITLDGGGSLRPFTVSAGASVTLARFTIANGADPAAGGALLNGGTVTLDGMTLTGNTASAGGGGAVVNLHGAQMVVTGSSFTANAALLGGGAILNGAGVPSGPAALLHVSNSTFSGNTAGQDPVPWGNGGAVVNQGTATLSATRFEDNHASHDGGAIYNRGPLTITNSTFQGNTVLDSGAGLKNNGGAVLVTGSTFTAQDARGEGGGGLSQDGGSLTMANSTVSGNRAGTTGEGGGVLILGGTMALTHVTIAGNRAGSTSGSGGGLRNRTGSGVTLANSLVAGNTAPGGGGPDCNGAFTLTAPVMLTQTSGCALSGLAALVDDPLLSPLGNNGGPTQSHLLLAGSPALNIGAAAVCTASPVAGVDQRGVVRPYGAGCELGATEASTPSGSNLRLTIGAVGLSWQTGNAQTAQHVLRLAVAPNGPVQAFGPLPATATSYGDATAGNGTLYCYLMTPADTGGILGLSDLLCTQLGLRTGASAPNAFAVSLGQTDTATLTWLPPAGGVDGYTLLVLPGNGDPSVTLPLSSGATTTTYLTGGGVTCFILFGIRSSPATVGYTDMLCAVPGVAALGRGSLARVPELAATMVPDAAALADRMAAVVSEHRPEPFNPSVR